MLREKGAEGRGAGERERRRRRGVGVGDVGQGAEGVEGEEAGC